MSTTTLTDRYVWAVSRQLPEETGPDVARELRGTLADAIEDKIAAGADPETAEKEAVTELGDPDVLAREYGGRPNHLIGPRYYPEWVRLERMLFTVVMPILAVIALVGGAFGQDVTIGSVVGGAVLFLLQAAVHMLVWPTVIFALIERSGSATQQAEVSGPWDPDTLITPDAPWRRVGFGEMAAEAAFGTVVALLVIWQFAGVGDRGVQVLDPELALGWKAAVIGLMLAEVGLIVLSWALGRWTLRLALVNVLLNIALGALLVWLLLDGRLLTDLPVELGERFGWDTDWSVSQPAVVIGIVVVCAWDAVSALLRVRRTAQAERFLDQ